MIASTIGLLLQLLATPSPDNSAARAARSAQQRFESLHRTRLPVDWRGGGASRCDARIGRYCYWYDSTESAPVAEPSGITRERDRLIAILDSAARRTPRDGWIAGQRVRYLLDAGRADSAMLAARECDSERWWCSALLGLASHVGENYDVADSAFAAALDAMPPASRCEWQDIRELLPRSLANELSRTDCAERGRLTDRLLILAQPLWATPGHDWRTEIYARRTMAFLLERASNPQMSWGDDSRELMMRYGWSEWYTKSDAIGLYSAPAITGHDREPSYNVFPDVASIRSVRLDSSMWTLRAQFATSRYSPRSLARLGALRHQLARFPRGDSLLLVARYATRDTALERDSLSALLLALQRDTLRRDSLHRSTTHSATLILVVPSDEMVASIEVIGKHSKHAERARYSVDPLPRHGSAVMSDVLLFDPQAADESFGGVIAAALPDVRVAARAPIGVYWEIQGVPSGPATMSLTVEPVHVGLARRLATRFRLARELSPVRLRWQAIIDSAAGQRVTIRLPDNARGSYRLVLTMQQGGGDALTTARLIEVVQ
jgi:hypothetical protein